MFCPQVCMPACLMRSFFVYFLVLFCVWYCCDSALVLHYYAEELSAVLIAVAQQRVPPRVGPGRDLSPGPTLRQAGAITTQLCHTPS
jgi:hypothetical protein